MNKLRIIVVAITLLISYSAKSQNLTKRAQNVFIELGGQGLTFTANYDTRFTKSRDGFGGRVGIGYISDSGDKLTTIPVSLNYLLGKGNKFLEVGLGATYLSTTGNNDVLFSNNESSLIGTMSFAYRLQPVDSGFSFRAGISPVFSKDFFIPYYGGISLGYTF